MRLAWRDLRTTPGRYLVIALGIALGTAIMVGSATSRSASRAAVEGTIDAYSGGADVAAVPVGSSTGRLPDGADALRQAPGVRSAKGVVSASVHLEGAPGRSVDTTLLTASEGGPDDALLGATIVAGANVREGSTDLVLPATLARRIGVDVGSTVRVRAARPIELTVSGLIDDHGIALANAGFTGFTTLDAARTMNGMADGYSSLRLWLHDPDATPSWIRDNARSAPTGVLLQDAGAPGSAVRDLTSTISSGLDLLAVVTLFLGAMLCYHLNQIAATTDRRRTALLLALGATRADARRIILIRSMMVAALGATAGCVLGRAIGQVMAPTVARLLGLLPHESSPTVATYGLAVAAAMAIAAVSLAALPLKELRPIEAMAHAHVETKRHRPRPIIGALAVIASAAAILVPGLPAGALVLMGLGLLLGATLLLRDAMVAFTGRLARSSGRRPVRMLALRAIAADASSSGVAMGLLMTAFAVSLSAVVAHHAVTRSVEASLARELGADLQVLGTQPLDGRADELRRIPGVRTVTLIAFGTTVAQSDATLARDARLQVALPLVAIDPASYFDVADLHWTAGDTASVRDRLAGPGAIALAQPIADQLEVAPGGVVKVRGPDGPVELRVAATFTSVAGTSGVVSLAEGRAHLGLTDAQAAFIDTDAGRADAVALALDDALPDARSVVLERTRRHIQNQLLSLWGIAYSSLLVTAVLAAIGLGASLHASVSRREDELRLLRQIGASGRQIVQMVFDETAAIVVIGFVAAIPIGFVLARVTLEVFRQGTGADIAYLVPIAPLVGFPLAMVPIALIATLLPARRATRIPLTPS